MNRLAIHIILLAGLLASSSVAQVNFNINSITGANYPEVSAEFTSAFNGEQIRTLNPSNFTVVENGITRPVTYVSCPDPITPPVSITLTFDVSNSMAILNKLENAKSAARTLVQALDFPPARVGITGFDDTTYIFQPYSNNKSTVLTAIDNVQTLGNNTDLQGAFTDPVKGALDFTENQVGDKYIVIFTDYQQDLSMGQQRAIWERALAEGIKIITVLVTEFDVSWSLRNIANNSGGQWYESVNTEAEAIQIFESIAANLIYIYPECELRYETDGCEPRRDVQITLRYNGRQDTENRTYTVPQGAITTLEVLPSHLDFGNIPNGTTQQRTVQIRALDGNITVNSIANSVGRFTVVGMGGLTPPFTIAEGESVNVTIEYRSAGPGRVSEHLPITADTPCQNHLILAGGEVNDNPIRLDNPNGGGRYFVDDVLEWRWSGVQSTAGVQLEYSTDAGLNWYRISTAAYNFRRNWIVSNTPSDSCIGLVWLDGQRTLNKDSSWLPTQPRDFTGVAVAPGGSIMAVALSDGRIKLYYPFDGVHVRTFTAHGGGVNGLSFSPDSRYLATSGGDRRLKVWDISDGSLEFQTPTFPQPTYGVHFSEDGQYLAGGDNGIVRLYATSDWSEQWSVTGQASADGDVVIDPLSRWVASTRGNSVVILDIADGARIQTLNGHSGAVRSLDVSDDGRVIASGSADNSVRIWNTFHWRQSNVLTGHSGTVNSVDLTSGGLQVISGSDDNSVRVWDTRSGGTSYTFNGHGDDVRGVSHSRLFGMVASVGEDRTVRVWSFLPELADKSDSNWAIVARVTDLFANVPEFDVLQCPGETSERRVVLYNTGNQPVAITNALFEGGDPGNFSITSTNTPPPEIVLQPEDSLVFTVEFTATVPRDYDAVLRFETDHPTLTSLTVPLTGTLLNVDYTISRTEFDFGELYHCTVPVTDTLIVTNTGEVDINITLPVNELDGIVSLEPGMPILVRVGESDTLVLTLDPTAYQLIDGTLELESSPCGIRAPFTVKADYIDSHLLVSPNPIDFDFTPVGDRSHVTVTVTNPTSIPRILEVVEFSELEFSMRTPADVPANIPPMGDVSFDISYVPTSEGSHSAIMRVISYAPCLDTTFVEVRGSSSRKPEIVATPPTFQDLICPDELSTAADVLIRNIGGTDLVIDTMYFQGPFAVNYSFATAPVFPITLSPNGSSTHGIQFDASVIGLHAAELVVINNSENAQTFIVQLLARKDSVGFEFDVASFDYGEVYHCDLPITEQVILRNTGTLPVSISMNPASQPVWVDFSIAFPQNLAVGEEITFDMTIDPLGLGMLGAGIAFEEDVCNTMHLLDVNLVYADSRPILSASLIDFGSTAIGIPVQGGITVQNQIGSPITIAAMEFEGPADGVSRLQPATLPVSIASGGVITAQFEYNPAAPGSVDTRLRIITSAPCIDTLYVNVLATSQPSVTEVSLPETSAEIGERIVLPLFLESSQNLALSGATAFIAEVSYNASMLWLEDVTAPDGTVDFSTTMNGDIVTVQITVDRENVPSTGVLAELHVLATLGNDTTTALSIDSFVWTDGPVSVNTIDGSFKTLGVCMAGGARLVRFNRAATLFQNAPNPFNPVTEIAFTLPEPMQVRLEVFSSLGERISVLADKTFEEGYHTLRFDGSNLASGVYIAVMRAGGDVQSIRMIQMK
ncbi:MAG: hypothetical protein CL946_13245 [Ectothiorhodospiraceae bacterium]|nr:hypothetical protein [Ectothiorhodospiraceae bacterium]